MGLCPCSTSQCWLSIPMWNLTSQLSEVHRHPKMAAAKTEDLQRAFAVCCIRCRCPYLHAWVVFHRYAVVSSLFLLFVFSIFFVCHDDVLCWLLSCPFSSVCFPCLSQLCIYLYWYSCIVYFVCDSASEFGAMGSTPFFGSPTLTCFLFF